MKIIPIDQEQVDQQILMTAVKFLREDNLIIHPTETVYGIAGQYNGERVLQEISIIKSRRDDQPFSIMVESVEQMLDLSGQESYWLQQLLSGIFPNPLTVLITRRKDLGVRYWDQFPLIGFRCPDHLWSRSLIRHTRIPLITTSANLSGNPPASTVAEISPELMSQVSLVLDGGITRFRLPSTIIKIDEKNKNVELIRAGAMSWQKIQNLINF
jgi:L-threonylcarbamoyladenylate synthase